jgi:hypothetical protein
LTSAMSYVCTYTFRNAQTYAYSTRNIHTQFKTRLSIAALYQTIPFCGSHPALSLTFPHPPLFRLSVSPSRLPLGTWRILAKAEFSVGLLVLSEAIISCASSDPRLIAFFDDSIFASACFLFDGRESAGQSATVAGVSAPDAQP